MSSGVSADVVITHDENARYIRHYEKTLHEGIADFAERIYKRTNYQGTDFIFELVISNDTLFAEEQNSGMAFELFKTIDLIQI